VQKKNNQRDLRRKVERFLSDFKNCLDVSNRFIKSRYVNDQTILKLGFSLYQIKEVLYSLTPEDYYEGPEPDKYHGGNFWVFGKLVQGCMLYIKIKIHTQGDGTDVPYCLSFHESTSPMNDFPLVTKK